MEGTMQSETWLDFLQNEGIDRGLLEKVEQYRHQYPCESSDVSRVRYRYYGKEVWEKALTALLCGEHLLLTGSKATGKNVLAENLACVFGRPIYNVSFHINMDAVSMIGTDTFRGGEVVFRPGPVYESAREGGFCILDEINMARNEALAVLHSALDFRREIHVPGYESIRLHDATRFIATMNHGYAGTRELNEALASRFLVIRMPAVSTENLVKLIRGEFPEIRNDQAEQFAALFADIRKKAENGELTEKVLDLRGLLGALRLMQNGLSPWSALEMGMIDKTFDEYEQTLVRDIIASRISRKMTAAEIFAR